MSVVPLPITSNQAKPVSVNEEADLIERAKRDGQAFAVLYRRHYPALAAHVHRRTGDVHVTEDLVSEVFLTVLRTLPRYRYRGVPLRFWMLRIATNAVNRWARRQRRRGTISLPPEQLEGAGPVRSSEDDRADGRRARQALHALPPKYQTVLALRYFEGLGVKEVAAVVGCRVGTVKSRLARGREALRKELDRRR